jgi:Flp pilus assembly pilin Flp
MAALAPLGQLLIGIFSGPVGWVALLVAAGVAIYAFRDQIGAAFQAIGDYLTKAAQGFKLVFIDPVANALKAMVDGIKSLFSGLAQALAAPFTAAANMIKGIVNGIIGGIERGINGATRR